MPSLVDRRQQKREAMFHNRRRYPRLFLDVDWFLEADGCSTLGRGLEISPRGALLPIQRTATFSPSVVLYVCLPARPRMFKAQGLATPTEGDRGWLIRFTEVSGEDLTLLGSSLVDFYGLEAIPNLDRRFGRFTDLPRRAWRASI